jgi:predicted RND superfamily exporter protein
MKKKLFSLLSPEVWTFLGLIILSIFILFNFVDLTPHVDSDFFFSSDDPQFQSEKKISALFQRSDTQVIISASGDINSKEYLQKISALTDELQDIEGITNIKSISNGPRNLYDALNSPLWKRILIADDRQSTNLVIILDEAKSKQIVENIEKIIEKNNSPGFTIRISGLPYVVELISRFLLRDLRTFSLIAFLVFGIVILLIFRSKLILTGTMFSCLGACMWTFMITHLMDVPIGLLTANLATIIFVLTLSHMVFLTYNWKHACTVRGKNCVDHAVNITFEASFWSMMTTLLGFLSLWFVPAKPLRELGISGAVGTVVSIVVAYSVFPAFLKMTTVKKGKNTEKVKNRLYSMLENNRNYIRLAIILFCLIALPGIWKMNTDPSLLAFFSKNSKIYKGLKHIDKNGGSSPFVIVVESDNGIVLNSSSSYAKMWKLQSALERHRAVGSVISLPVIMAEARQEPFAFFLSWNWLLDILAKPKYGEIAKSFVTENRQYGLFLLRMNELNRVQKRLTIVDELKEIVKTQGFVPKFTGGVYKLQGHMSRMVVSSLIKGLVQLLALFVIIAWIVSRSFKVGIAMIFSLILIPLSILGAIGIYRIPLDVISSPASNVAIAMGIDSMIHLVKSYRRKKQESKENKNIWQEVRNQMWQPVLTSMVIVCTGFAIFLFSSFPPTQRFGGAIVFGTIIASLTALYILPLFAPGDN